MTAGTDGGNPTGRSMPSAIAARGVGSAGRP